MTSQERHIFYELLRSSLWEHEPDLTVFEGEWDWNTILQAYQNHSLLGIVADVIANLPEDCQPPAEQQFLLFNHIGNLIQSHQTRNRAIGIICGELKEAGCFPILLKGQGLSILYPKKCIRSCGDIDIYVGPLWMETAKQVVRARASEEAIKMADAGDVDHEYKIIIEGLVFEIHRYPGGAGNKYKSKTFKDFAVNALSRENSELVALPLANDSISVMVPDAKINVWYIFNHIVQHFHVSGVGLRQFCDWMMVLKQLMKDMDRDAIEAELMFPLQKMGLVRSWKILSGILVHQLGFSAESMPLYDAKMAQKSQGYILDQIIEGEDFRFGMMPDGHQDSNIFRRVLNSLEVYYKTSRSTFVISRSYPIRKFYESFVYCVRRIKQEAFDKFFNGGQGPGA